MDDFNFLPDGDLFFERFYVSVGEALNLLLYTEEVGTARTVWQHYVTVPYSIHITISFMNKTFLKLIQASARLNYNTFLVKIVLETLFKAVSHVLFVNVRS